MADELDVVTDALRVESSKWHRLSDSMMSVKLAAERLTLAPTAFYIGQASGDVHSAAYDEFHAFLTRVLGEAATEFDEIGAVLRDLADRYDEADAVIALDLNDVYRR